MHETLENNFSFLQLVPVVRTGITLLVSILFDFSFYLLSFGRSSTFTKIFIEILPCADSVEYVNVKCIKYILSKKEVTVRNTYV